MIRHKPAHLPEVDSLEITHHGGEHILRSEQLEPQWISKETIVFAPEPTARRFAKLWRNLPDGSKAKCFAPAFRLRFFAKEVVLVDADVCWACSRIRIKNEAPEYDIGFDPSSSAAQKLLSLLTEATTEASAT